MTFRPTCRASGRFAVSLALGAALALAGSARAPAAASPAAPAPAAAAPTVQAPPGVRAAGSPAAPAPAATLGARSSAALSPPPAPLAPTERERMVARRVGSILEETHYSRKPIDRAMSSRIFDRYLEFLDGEHSYFLASDIAEFQKWRYSFAEMIHTGNVDPAFQIFDRFQQRDRERMRYALSLLTTEPGWKVDERYTFDRTHSPWPADLAAANDLWRKRVKNDELSLMLTGKTWKQATDILRKRYSRVLRRIDQISSEDVFEELMNSYARTYDPHSSYFSPEDSEEYRIQMSLNYDGIGAQLELENDYVTVTNVIQGGPAAVAGTLKPNDRITGVGQGSDGAFTDVIGWRLSDVVQLIRGKAGTTVRLKILPAGVAPGSPEKTLRFVRNKVTLGNDAAQSSIRTVKRGGRLLKIGVIRVPAFYEDVAAENAGDPNYRSTTRDVRRLIKQLQTKGIDGLILDLRENGGGYLPEATALTGLFIDKGPVVQLKDSTGHLEVLDDPDKGVVYTGPLAVLVDRYSASASEIFAGAIQDYHRGVIVGQRTFGKGTVQNLVPLDRWTQRPVNGQLTVTIGKFYRITGQSTQRLGVEPDVPLPSPIDMSDVGETSLENALPWDRIAPVPYVAWQPKRAHPVAFRSLALAEDERAGHDPDYRWLVQEVAASEDLHGEKSVSLDLAVRKRNLAREDRDELARANLRRAGDHLPPIKSVSQLTPNEASDIQLAECTQVVADMVTGVHLEPSRAPLEKTARRGGPTEVSAGAP